MGCRGGSQCRGWRRQISSVSWGTVSVEIVGVGPAAAETVRIRTGTEQKLAELAPGDLRPTDDVRLDWNTAMFLGHHRLFGDILIELAPDSTSSGTVTPVGRERQDSAYLGFFPAASENSFKFRLHLPRIRTTFANGEPVRLTSVISGIPPFGAVYELAAPVRFQTEVGRRRVFTIMSSLVSILPEKNLSISLRRVISEGTKRRIIVELRNESPLDHLEVVWAITMPHTLRARRTIGVIKLGRAVHRLAVEIDGDGFSGPADVCVGAGIRLPLSVQGWTAVSVDLAF